MYAILTFSSRLAVSVTQLAVSMRRDVTDPRYCCCVCRAHGSGRGRHQAGVHVQAEGRSSLPWRHRLVSAVLGRHGIHQWRHRQQNVQVKCTSAFNTIAWHIWVHITKSREVYECLATILVIFTCFELYLGKDSKVIIGFWLNRKYALFSLNTFNRIFRDLRLLSIGGGADEVMLSIICKYMGTLPDTRK